MFNSVIIDNFTNPTFLGELENPTLLIESGNPVCDDRIKIGLSINNNLIDGVGFTAYGCATSLAASNILCSFLKDQNIEDIETISRDEIIKLLGNDLEPNQMHCVDIFNDLLETIVLKIRENVIL